jgi:hypothetical protein
MSVTATRVKPSIAGVAADDRLFLLFAVLLVDRFSAGLFGPLIGGVAGGA